MRTFGKRVTGSYTALPPLLKPGHGYVMQGHLGVDAEDDPPPLLKTNAQLGFLARNELRLESSNLAKRSRRVSSYYRRSI